MPISTLQRRKLKAQAHSLNPVIIMGSKGLTTNLALETERALDIHELIKVRINAESRIDRKRIAVELCEKVQADLIQMIGHIAIIFRKKPDEK